MGKEDCLRVAVSIARFLERANLRASVAGTVVWGPSSSIHASEATSLGYSRQTGRLDS